MRIAVAGFQHETNTFSSVPATLADFTAADAWPGLVEGADLLDAVRGINLPAAGFIAEAEAARHRLIPLLWCSATPSGRVTQQAFEKITRRLLTRLMDCRDRIDAVYLDLHGAMATEHLDDADGELLHRIRTVMGDRIPVIASLDFHANVSRQMLDRATLLCAYRSYPHIDMSVTGARAARALFELGTTARLPWACRRLPFLLPLTTQCTLVEPLASVMSEVERLERAPILSLNFTPGFPAADVPKCGPVVFGYGTEPTTLQARIDGVAATLEAREPEFALDLFSIQSALRELRTTEFHRGRPVILADTQDNPGGGGYADSTSLLKALHAARIPRVLAGVLCDPTAAAQAHAAGRGARIEADLGGHAPIPGESPLHGTFDVAALGDGVFTATGPFYRGARMDLGPMALLRLGELSIAVASRKQQAADQAMFRHLGIEPVDSAVLVLKSSVHFRADFGPIAQRVLIVAAPGPNVADPADLPFTKLPSHLRRKPRSA